jgi:hypothetical protein
MRNFHLPLPDQTYEELKAEARRSNIAATAMARHAIQTWLEVRQKAQRRKAIVDYAAAVAGTRLDLDPTLERATVEFLLKSESK